MTNTCPKYGGVTCECNNKGLKVMCIDHKTHAGDVVCYPGGDIHPEFYNVFDKTGELYAQVSTEEYKDGECQSKGICTLKVIEMSKDSEIISVLDGSGNEFDIHNDSVLSFEYNLS